MDSQSEQGQSVAVWLDDSRDAPSDAWSHSLVAAEAIELIPRAAILHLDHDLGWNVVLNREEPSGMTVLNAVEDYVQEGFAPPWLFVHTGNPAARIHMLLAVQSIYRFAQPTAEVDDWLLFEALRYSYGADSPVLRERLGNKLYIPTARKRTR